MSRWGLRPAGLLIMMSPCLGRCFFCAQPAVTNPPRSEWTGWTRVASLLEENPQVGLTRLCIGGTEPTTHPDFYRALQLANDHGFTEIELMTSGVPLAEPGEAQRWRKAGIQTIATPIYSADAAVHDAVTGMACHATLLRGLDAAKQAGIEVRLHTLALTETLAGLEALAALVQERWQHPLTLAPARPKDAVWSYAQQAPSLTAVAQALGAIEPGAIQLTGWPDCLAPSHARGAAQVIDLYFRGQTRDYAETCIQCSGQPQCPGVVSALLQRDGSQGLSRL